MYRNAIYMLAVAAGNLELLSIWTAKVTWSMKMLRNCQNPKDWDHLECMKNWDCEVVKWFLENDKFNDKGDHHQEIIDWVHWMEGQPDKRK
jgi:hypothetical protein